MTNILDELDKLERVATPGPYYIRQGGEIWKELLGNCAVPILLDDNLNEQKEKDAVFLCALRNKARSLIDLARAIKACEDEGFLFPDIVQDALSKVERE